MTDLLIDGDWICGAGPTLSSYNPADGTVVWSGSQASAAQAANAMQAAERALPSWMGADRKKRVDVVRRFGQYLNDHADALARLISDETGKPFWEAKTEVATSIAKVDVSIAALRERRSEIRRGGSDLESIQRFRALGVMVVLGPFNFPAHLPGGQVIPALLAGNTVVFKPSEQAAAVGRWLADAWLSSGLPNGVLNLVQGDRMVAEALIDDPGVAGVLFTGGYRAGCAIHRRLAGRPEVLLALEMGGNNPLVVHDTRATDAAIALILQSAFATSGQRCTCARRLIVVDCERGREVVERLVDAIPKIRIGLPHDNPAPFMGPLISPSAAAHVMQTQQSLVDAGAKALIPCAVDPRCSALVAPGLVDVSGIDVADEECFGPLLQLRLVKTFEEACQSASATRYGLAACLLGSTRQDFDHFREVVSAGVVNWNCPTTGASGQLAFGGLGASGNHRPAGYFMADACSDPITSLQTEDPRLPSSMPKGLDRIFKT